MCECFCMCVGIPMSRLVWRSEGNLQNLVIFFHHLDCGDKNPGYQLCTKNISPKVHPSALKRSALNTKLDNEEH